jgi:hypothetical protein
VALFLLGAIGLSLAPVLILSAHASETYVYLPMAFVAMFMAYAITRLAAWRRPLAIACVAGMLLMSCAATVTRNQRVVEAGRTGARILAALPASLAYGEWEVVLADRPGEGTTARYGFYAFHGTGTIGAPPHADEALTCALQLHFRNEALRGRVLEPAAFAAACARGARAGEVLAWVRGDGRLEPCDAGPRP